MENQTNLENKDTYDYWFKIGFGLAMVEVGGADDVKIDQIYNALDNYKGDTRNQAKALIVVLGQKNWKWKPFEGEKDDYFEMAKALATRVEILAHRLLRRHQILSLVDERPYWQFHAGRNDHTPLTCLMIDEVIKHCSDELWQKHLPPCDSPYCECQIFALSEFDLEKMGIQV